MANEETSVHGLRVLVVGASSGIGRELASQLSVEGASVVACARRRDRIDEIAGISGLRCDVLDPQQCHATVATAGQMLGGLDAVIYVAGITRITALDNYQHDDWMETFGTNVIGAASIAAAAIPYLTSESSAGRALFLTSDAADNAMPGLVAYAASKSALGRFCQGLAIEFPALRVSEVVVGPTAGTDMADQFQPDEMERWVTRWFEGGFIRHELLQPPEVVRLIINSLTSESPPSRVLAVGQENDSARPLPDNL